MSEMQGLASAIRLLAAAAKDKIDDALLSEFPIKSGACWRKCEIR